eukprot:696455-Rhodomonas_salina.2
MKVLPSTRYKPLEFSILHILFRSKSFLTLLQLLALMNFLLQRCGVSHETGVPLNFFQKALARILHEIAGAARFLPTEHCSAVD